MVQSTADNDGDISLAGISTPSNELQQQTGEQTHPSRCKQTLSSFKNRIHFRSMCLHCHTVRRTSKGLHAVTFRSHPLNVCVCVNLSEDWEKQLPASIA